MKWWDYPPSIPLDNGWLLGKQGKSHKLYEFQMYTKRGEEENFFSAVDNTREASEAKARHKKRMAKWQLPPSVPPDSE